MSQLKEYVFDVKFYAQIRVRAASEDTARQMVRDRVYSADADFGTWENGDKILAEVVIDDGELYCYRSLL